VIERVISNNVELFEQSLLQMAGADNINEVLRGQIWENRLHSFRGSGSTLVFKSKELADDVKSSPSNAQQVTVQFDKKCSRFDHLSKVGQVRAGSYASCVLAAVAMYARMGCVFVSCEGL
jgi:hypothetical protein